MSSWCKSYIHNRPLTIHYNSRLNTVYQTLSSSYEIGANVMRKAIDVEYNKGVISGQTRELDDAFQQFSVSRPVVSRTSLNLFSLHCKVLSPQRWTRYKKTSGGFNVKLRSKVCASVHLHGISFHSSNRREGGS